jgi:catechol 2,3-dioxygenase-like lactoylglutathione lyase family enzyme
MPLHHVGCVVPNLDEAKEFYLAALAPLGYIECHTYPGMAVGLGVSKATSDFWLSTGNCPKAGGAKPPTTGLHLAFKAESREVVDQFHEAAL